MDIVPVEHLLAHLNNGGDPLHVKRIAALDPRREPFFALLCQPPGTIHASTTRIGNADQNAVLPMYRAFFCKAISSQAQLAITPEYSVPWSLLDDIAFGDLQPPQGVLWTIGFESITPSELEALRAHFQGRGDRRLIYEMLDPQQRAQKHFVDPLVYVFWATDNVGLDVLCFLVQFKTVPCRDADHVELTSLYLGKSVYKFTAQPGDVSLIGLICSDVFEFSNALVDEHHQNLLLVHIQLNKRPGHVDYAGYRTRLFSVASKANVEIVCLNWSAQVKIEGEQGPWNLIPGSAWYVGPENVSMDDNAVNKLHGQGVYYCVVGNRWHAFYFNYAPHYVLLRKQPVFCTGPQAIAPRIAPEVVERAAWNSQQGSWLEEIADDGFTTFMHSYAALSATLPQLCGQDPLAVERALELLEGPKGHFASWYTLKDLQALRVADEESIQRVTVSQETDSHRSGVAFRQRRARLAQTTATIPTQPFKWPASLADLSAGFSYRWTKSDPHNNVAPTGVNGNPAAIVYLGEDPEVDTISNVHARLSKARKTHAVAMSAESGGDVGDAAGRAEDRLCIVYKRDHVLEFHRPPGYVSITDSSSKEHDDITGNTP